MKTLSEISRNLNANIQTRQITNAMYLLSVSQVRRMSSTINYVQNYMSRLRLTLRDILLHSGGVKHAFIRHHKNPKASAFIVVSSDKSLCGSFNTDVADLACEKIRQVANPVVFTAGRSGETILRSRGIIPAETLEISSANISLSSASQIADSMIERFLDEEFDEVFLVFTRYFDQLHRQVVCIRLFPVLPEDFTDEISDQSAGVIAEDTTIYEPGLNEAFEALINEYVSGMIYSGFVQSAMCEHISRMDAMQGATRNADERIASLKLQYNSARQLAVTNEIAEIFGASNLTEQGN